MPLKKRTVLKAFAAAVLVCLSLTACQERVAEPNVDWPALRQLSLLDAVTSDVAALVRPDGTFELGVPPLSTRPMITAQRATELAVAFIRQFGRYNQSALERAHGGPIYLERLVPSTRVYFAESPHNALPDEVPVPYHKGFGPYYLVTLLQTGVPAVSVAVSAYDGDLEIKDGRIRFPSVHGNDFRSHPLPRDLSYALPISPEDAVRLASLATGARVTAVPRLVRPPVGSWVVNYAVWKLDLDRDVVVTVKASGSEVTTRHVYLDRRGQLLYGVDQAGPQRKFTIRDPVTERTGSFQTTILLGMPGEFLPVIARRSGGRYE